MLLRLALRALPSRRTLEQLLGGLGNEKALRTTLQILEQARIAQRRNQKIRLNLEYKLSMAKDKVSPAPDEEVRSTAATSNASSGTKRKRANEPKFYAVKDGRKPGIYANYNDCLEQVKGFKGAVCASIPSSSSSDNLPAMLHLLISISTPQSSPSPPRPKPKPSFRAPQRMTSPRSSMPSRAVASPAFTRIGLRHRSR